MSTTETLLPDSDMGDMSSLTAKDFHVPDLGPCTYDTTRPSFAFVSDEDRVLLQTRFTDFSSISMDMSFALAGQREKMFFDPHDLVVGIVTCGGLCPGLNDVIRALTYASINYGVKKVIGFKFGYQGLSKKYRNVIRLEPKDVNSIHELGGTFLGSTRGNVPVDEMVQALLDEHVSILFTIGGDGTQNGANCIYEEITRRKLPISVIGVPKTIDNDICFLTRTFGFDTAVEKARDAISAAHQEAASLPYGIGVVRVMGRDSGFIAAKATIASGDVNICLIPEEKFTLPSLMARVEDRLIQRHHCVIVVAEGAGEEVIAEFDKVSKDASGNTKHSVDIGPFLVDQIKAYFKHRNEHIKDPQHIITPTVKYIDPSYMIRSCKPTAADAAFCEELGNKAVDSALCGKTGCIVGFWNDCFTLVPFSLIHSRRKKVSLQGNMWNTVRQITWPEVPELEHPEFV